MSDCEHSDNLEWMWAVSLTSPIGETGITLNMCHPCLSDLLLTRAVQELGRTVHVRKVER